MIKVINDQNLLQSTSECGSLIVSGMKQLQVRPLTFPDTYIQDPRLQGDWALNKNPNHLKSHILRYPHFWEEFLSKFVLACVAVPVSWYSVLLQGIWVNENLDSDYCRAVLTARDARWIAIFMPCYDYRAWHETHEHRKKIKTSTTFLNMLEKLKNLASCWRHRCQFTAELRKMRKFDIR